MSSSDSNQPLSIDQLDINTDVAAIQMMLMRSPHHEDGKQRADQTEQQEAATEEDGDTLAPSDGRPCQQHDVSPCWAYGVLVEHMVYVVIMGRLLWVIAIIGLLLTGYSSNGQCLSID